MRLAIVGCGLIGGKRAAAAAGHDIVVVCDRDPSRAEALARRTKARAVTDWRDAVKADVDAVMVATTHDQLAAIALGAVEAGRHVLVEKPFTMNAVEAREIVQLARDTGRFAMEAMWTRFLPHVVVIRDWLARGVLGETYLPEAVLLGERGDFQFGNVTCAGSALRPCAACKELPPRLPPSWGF